MLFNKISKTLLLASIATTVFLSSCKKEDPHHNHDNEEYDSLKVHFIGLDAGGTQANDTITISYDAHGTASPALTNVQAGKQYRMLIELYAHNENINPEIIADAADHQFFFFANPSNSIASYEYNDAKIGLDGKISFAGPGNFQIQALLRHGLNKDHADAQAYNSQQYQNAGGSNDVNINLDLQSN